MGGKSFTQFSIRLPEDLYRKLRFIAADSDQSLNQVITEALQAAAERTRISVPSDLLKP